MSDDSIEIVAFPDDENVNVLNYAPTSPRGGTKIGVVSALPASSASGENVRRSKSPRANANAAATVSPDLSVSTEPDRHKSTPPAWSHPLSPTKSPQDHILKFRSPVNADDESEGWEDEIMKFRADSSDSDGDNKDAGAAAEPAAKPPRAPVFVAPQKPPANHLDPVNIEDCISVESLRVLPTILEAISDDSMGTDNILSHEGTEYASITSGESEDTDGSVEVCDDGSIQVVDMSRLQKLTATFSTEYSMRKETEVSKKSPNDEAVSKNPKKEEVSESPKKVTNLTLNVKTDVHASQEIADLDQMLADLNNDPCEGPFSPLVGEHIMFSPRWMQESNTPRRQQQVSPRNNGPASPRGQATSPRAPLSPRQTGGATSPRTPLSPRQVESSTSPRAPLSPRQVGQVSQRAPVSPRQTNLASPRAVPSTSRQPGLASPRAVPSPRKSVGVTSPKALRSPRMSVGSASPQAKFSPKEPEGATSPTSAAISAPPRASFSPSKARVPASQTAVPSPSQTQALTSSRAATSPRQPHALTSPRNAPSPRKPQVSASPSPVFFADSSPVSPRDAPRNSQATHAAACLRSVSSPKQSDVKAAVRSPSPRSAVRSPSPQSAVHSSSPRSAFSPRQSESDTSPDKENSSRHNVAPAARKDALSPKLAMPLLAQESSDDSISQRKREDPPSLILEVTEEVVSRRLDVRSAVAEANHLKEQLDVQMCRTQEYSDQVLAKIESETKLQNDLERQLQEIARHNEELQADIEKLEWTKKELQASREEVQREKAELCQLKEEHSTRSEALEEELELENKVLQDEIEILVSAKREIAEARYKAEKEETELALIKKEYAEKMKLMEAEKKEMKLAIDQAARETSEMNELSQNVMRDLEKHKASVQDDIKLVKELHQSRLQILNEEKVKLEAAARKAEQETEEVKENTAEILNGLEEKARKEELEVRSLREEYEAKMEALEKEKGKLNSAIEQAAKETTETKDMTRTVLSELEEYKEAAEKKMKAEVKEKKDEIKRMEEEHEKTMDRLVTRSETLQAEITSEQQEVQEIVKDMEESIETLHQKKENMENELTLRIESVNQSTKESKRELQQELNKARFSKAKNRFDKLRGHATESLKCATVDVLGPNIESFSQAAYSAIMEPFSDDLLIKQAKAPEFRAKKSVKQGAKPGTKQPPNTLRRSASHGNIKRAPSLSPRSRSRSRAGAVIRQTNSLQMEGKIVSPREVLL